MKTNDITKKLVSTRPYQGFSLAQVAPRPGSTDIFNNPSRFGNKVRHKDGREILLRVREVQADE